MKKRALSIVLTTAMVAALFAGCGKETNDGGTTGGGNGGGNGTQPTVSPDFEYTATDGGKVLNIYCWNTEFKERCEKFLPGYTAGADSTSKDKNGDVSGTAEGTYNGVTVKWNITPSKENAYQNNLDNALLKQKDAAADDKVDLFLMEADYALKYVDTTYTVPIDKLGITDADTKDQFQYTKDVVTDANGNIKGLSWQGCPSIMFYNREAAKEIFGTDDPATIQEKFKDWATFKKTAIDEVAAKGYKIMSSPNDTFRIYSNNVSSKWVADDGVTINVDPYIKQWVDDSKELVDAGAVAGTWDLWGEDWSKGFFPEAKVFAYFGPAWLVNFSMSADTEGSIGYDGGWGGITGPQGFFWGGTWITAVDGTDNASEIKQIMLDMSCSADTAKKMVQDVDEFANNKPAMEEMAKEDSGYSSKVLGGQNPLQMYLDGLNGLEIKYASAYDQGCNEAFQNAMKSYFEGASTYDEALDAFYTTVTTKYPNLKKPA